MKFRKVFTSIALTAAMVAATVSTAWADPVYDNISVAPDYNGDYYFAKAITDGNDDYEDFYALSTDSSISVDDFTWEFVAGTATTTSITDSLYVDYYSDESVSTAFIWQGDNTHYGMGVLEVNNGAGNIMDFGVAVNAPAGTTITSASNIRTLVYDENGTQILDHTGSVSGSEFNGYSNYPTVLDALAGSVGTDNLTSVITSRDTQGYSYDTHTYAVDYLRYGDTQYPASYNYLKSWQYRVYDSTGAMVTYTDTNEYTRPLAQAVAPDVYDISGSGYTIIWKYGTDSITFPDSLN